MHRTKADLPWLLLGLPVCLAILVGLGLLIWRWSQSTTHQGELLPQDPQVRVYLNQNPTAEYTEPYRQIRRAGDNLEQVVIDTIRSAEQTVDVAVQEFRLPGIAQALIDRYRAGVGVRIILENSYARPFSTFTAQDVVGLSSRDRRRYQEAMTLIDLNRDGQLSPTEINQRDALVMLRNAGIPLIDDTADGSAGSSLMHHKFVVVDRHWVIVTSANFTTSDVFGDFSVLSSRGNANNLLQLRSPELAKLFTQEFELMWGDGPGGLLNSQFGKHKPARSSRTVNIGSGTVEVKFSPDSTAKPWAETTNGTIGKVLNQAQHSIDLALFVFSDQGLANILAPKHQQGVAIRALIDPGFAYLYYSEALDLMGVALVQRTAGNNSCQYEAGNQPWSNPLASVGTPRLPPGDKLHHKFGVVDQQTVITGSHNWSQVANYGNDEVLLVVQNATVAAHYRREFARLYRNAVLGVPSAIQRRVNAQQQQCPKAVNASQPSLIDVELDNQFGESTAEDNRVKQRAVAQAPHPTIPLGAQKINLNTASLAEIAGLPGVGPKLAQRIVTARQTKPFTTLDDLDRVPGIGPKLLNGLRDRITW